MTTTEQPKKTRSQKRREQPKKAKQIVLTNSVEQEIYDDFIAMMAQGVIAPRAYATVITEERERRLEEAGTNPNDFMRLMVFTREGLNPFPPGSSTRVNDLRPSSRVPMVSFPGVK